MSRGRCKFSTISQVAREKRAIYGLSGLSM
nr:MAG TPA: hypothetical protein [Caudoviricetes sp.]